MNSALRKVYHGGGAGWWGSQAEIDFVNGLGEWNEASRTKGETVEYWLVKYIEAHLESSWAHHRAGVAHARRLLGQAPPGQSAPRRRP